MDIKINIPEDANMLIHILQEHGHSAYVVGGCVRDCIFGRKPHDWDICTSATPCQMLEIFKDEKIIETGLQHGTVTVVINGEPYEITTYRIDGSYSDNRRPDKVTFTGSLKEDLRRRDFTINAMAYNDEEGLSDPFDGLDAIKCRRIECVGSPKERFEEDALRILRAIRFASQLDFTIVADTDWEIHQQHNKLQNISVERISSEFCKIILSDALCVQMVLYRDIFSLFIPELKDMFAFAQNNPYHIYDVYSHTIHAIEKCDSGDLVVRLAVLFHDIGKPHSFQDGDNGVRHFKEHGRVSAEITNEIMKRLRFDNGTRESVVELISYHDATFEVGTKYVKRWLNKIGENQFRRLLALRKADIQAQNPIYIEERLQKLEKVELLLGEVLSEDQCFTLKDLSVNGSDLISIGCKQGKELGTILNRLLEMVIADEIENDKEKLLLCVAQIK